MASHYSGKKYYSSSKYLHKLMVTETRTFWITPSVILFYALQHTKHAGLCARPVIGEHGKSRPLGAKITKSESAAADCRCAL